MNKKGVGADDFIPLMIVVVAFVLVLSVVLLANGNRERTIVQEVQDSNLNLDFVNRVEVILQKEVEFQGEKALMVDWLATLNEDEEEKKTFLMQEITEFFKDEPVWGWDLFLGGEAVFKAGNSQDVGWCQIGEYVIELPHSKIEVTWC